MAFSRKQKAALNILSTAFLELVTFINGLVLPRLIIRTYGSSYNGITASAAQFLNLISILTIGITATTRVALYRSLAADDIPKTSSIVRATEIYMRKVGSILAVYILLLACLYPLIVETGYSFWEVSSLALIVGMSSFADYFFGITYKTLLMSDQSLYIYNFYSAIATLLNLILSIILIRLGCSIQLVKLCGAAVFALKPVLLSIFARRKYHLERRCAPDNSAIKNRWDAMMHAIANIVHDNTDLVVLTLFTDIKTVSVYTVYNLVLMSLRKIEKIFTSGTEPIYGNMWAKGENDAIRQTLAVYEFLVSVFVSVAFSVTIVLILPFIALYTKNVTDVNYIRPVYAAVIVIAFFFFAYRTPYLSLVQGVGHYRQTRNGAIAEAVINLGLSVLLVVLIPAQEHKMVGVALGTLAANLFRTIQYALYIDRYIVHRGKHVCVCKILWSAANMAVAAVPGFILVSRMSIDSWAKWLGCAVCATLMSMLVTFVSSLLFYREDLKNSRKIVRSILKERLGNKRLGKSSIIKKKNTVHQILAKGVCSALELFPIRSNRMVLIGDGNFRDNTRVFFDYLIENKLNEKYEIIILVDDIEQYSFLKHENVKLLRRRAPMPASIENLYYMETASVLVYTHGISLPGRRPGQLCIHTTHSASQLKQLLMASAMSEEEKSSSLFVQDYHLRCGPEGQRIFMTKWGVEESKVPILGMPRLDLLYRHRDVLKLLFPDLNIKKCVLAMETFRHAAERGYNDSTFESRFGLNVVRSQEELETLSRYLEENGYLLIIKPHPKQDLRVMEKVKTRNIRFVVDDELERKGVQLYELVENCDIMLTDYSSIFYDFLLLNRPVGFLISDINEYTRGFFYSDPLSQMPGEKIRTAEELTRFFDKVNAGEDDWADERERIKNMVFTYQDANNCKRLLSFIEEHKK